MAITNHERVGKALELLRDGLKPFIERELQARLGNDWNTRVSAVLTDTRLGGGKGDALQDVAVVLVVMDRFWGDVFRWTLGKADRSLVNELLEVRHAWAHQSPFSGDDTYRALDTAERLLNSISAGPQAEEVGRLRVELQRVRYDEQVRTEKRRAASTAIETPVSGALPPWREVVTPHKDVASGRYQQAEFAADLWQVHIGEGSDEYREPREFFRRTYLTESLGRLLVGAVQRLSGTGGDPVVQLQTNFGGGKTHSMLALYHLFSGTRPGELAGVDTVLKEAGTGKLPADVKRVVLVGNKISPGNPVTKADGTVVRTLWGELAWQLGFAAGGIKEAKKAFKRVAADDEKATSPGDVLRTLMDEYAPCLILIDEWVAYARQLHDTSDLPAGSFETHFTFAQALTEAAKSAKKCLLVISLPASDTTGSPHAVADDVEVGGERGRAALDRLRNVVGRIEASWRPATAEEGFEIVRRRLFEPIVDRAQFVARDTVAKAFFEMYRTQPQEFPPECRDADYEKRLRAAYPIHPEIFDRLYEDWSTLVKFQRTRGVLRLMAAVIHTLWEKGDRNPLIMPANIAVDNSRVQFELTRYLSDNWVPVIAKDVDGPNALPLAIDAAAPNLGKYSACRRVARTIYLGSAPTAGVAHRGLEKRRVVLGCVMPGEPVAVFREDALRRLGAEATYLYQDDTRYWYATQPTVTKLADDRAEQLKGNPDAVAQEVEKRVRADLKKKGDFGRVHPMPQGGQDVPDNLDARLVVLGISHPYSKDARNKAQAEAQAILESCGRAPRLFRNTLVFLAVDQTRLQDLDDAARRYLAWESIVAETVALDLSPFQVKQAEVQRVSADASVAARLPEAYQWLLVPGQTTPQATMEWQVLRLTGQEGLAVRASRKLRNDELLIANLGGTVLRAWMDKIPLWRGDDVQVRQLVENFARYLYLPRLSDSSVLVEAIRAGVALLTWSQDAFAYAEGRDEATGRYRGLQAGRHVSLDASSQGLLVNPAVALRQMESEQTEADTGPETTIGTPPTRKPPRPPDETKRAETPKPKRFHATVVLDSSRVGRDASRFAEEVIGHLEGILGAEVRVTLEVDARVPGGVSDQVARIVTENCRTLKVEQHGFEVE